MEEQQSIFSDPLSNLSSRDFYSIAQWSKFIGILMFIGGGIFFIVGLAFREMMENISSLTQHTTMHPLFDYMRGMPTIMWMLLVVLISGLLILLGVLFIQVSKNSKDYYHTQSGIAFIKMMQAMRLLFLVGTISTVLTILPTLLTFFDLFL